MSRFRCHNFPLGKTRLRESAATLAAWARAHRFFIRASLPDGSRRAAFVCGQNTDTLAAGREPTGSSFARRYRTARAVPLLCAGKIPRIAVPARR
jgi:hypothetical protein